MKQHLGESRSSRRENYALIGPDSHEATTLPNWVGSSLAVVIAPQLGARFTEYFAQMPDGASATESPLGLQRFFLVLEGEVTLATEAGSHQLGVEGYGIVPAGMAHKITARGAARLIVLERPYLPLKGYERPDLYVSRVGEHKQVVMKGDDRLLLQRLVPESPRFDFEINVMEYKPGMGLPYVETHYMEHGILLMNGGGIFRLGTDWHPSEAGDVIWMGPYCAQWFGAIGRQNARYLIYKDYNRDPLLPGTY
jgi:(S)-ureidoglycine aminohydrolase